MRKLLLITTALIGLAGPAQAEPVTMAVAGLSAWAASSAIGAALLQIAGSFVLSAIAAKLQGRPRQEQMRRELARPTALPAYRFVYGYCWAPGTPVGWVVRGNTLYICYLLNSRPSSLTSHTVLLDKRAVSIAGDPFDFTASGGATATNEPFSGHVKYWIGRGDQTTCPDQIVSESGYFAATDAWRGRTVLWARLDCGYPDERAELWPNAIPELNIEGPWSLVLDPRDGATRYSRNQALCVLDALRTNPIREYAADYLWSDTFGEAADVADQAVAVSGGGTIPRYCCDGVLVWSDGSELEDQIEPLLAAGGSRLVRVGGKLGIVPAAARASVHTITDYTDGQPISLTRWKAGDELYTECVATYVAPDRAYEAAETPAYIVPGAQVADGGIAKRLSLQLDFVVDHRQAQRLTKIAVMRSRLQKAVSFELFPDAFGLVAGSRATLALPSLLSPWNTEYEVEQISPAAGVNDDSSITLRLPCALTEYSADVFAWSAATEEQAVTAGSYSTARSGVVRPASVTLSTGGDAALISGDNVTPRVAAVWPASASASTTGYEWQYRYQFMLSSVPVWSGWTGGGEIGVSDDDGPDYRAWIAPVTVDRDYQVRVRTIGVYGKSAWRTGAAITAAGPSDTLATPTILLAVGGVAKTDLTLRQGNDSAATRIEVWASNTNDLGTATLIGTVIAASNVTVAFSESGLPSGVRYYWLRARNGFDAASAYTAGTSATIS